MDKIKRNKVDIINHFELYIGTVIFILLMLILTLQVFSRYVFGRSFTWTEELGTIMFIWLVYLGSCAAVLEQRHLRIDLILGLVKGNVKKFFLIFSNIVTLLFCAYIIFPLTKIIMTLARRGSSTPLMGFPNWFAYSIIPVCMALMVIRLLQDTKNVIKSHDENVEKTPAKSVFSEIE